MELRRSVPWSFAVSVALLAAACSGGTGTPPAASLGGGASGGTLVIGASSAQTGILASYDQPALKGFQVWLDEMNAQGGIGGKWKIDFRIKDNRSEPAQAAIAAQELLDGGANLLVTTCDADPSVAAGQIAQKAKIPAISFCASTPTLPLAVGNFMFTSSMGDNAQGLVLAQYALKTGYKTAYLLESPDSAYTIKLPEYFQTVYEKGGGKVIGHGTYTLGAQDFSAEVTKIKGLNPAPDVIMTSAYIPDGPAFIKQLRAAGITIPVLDSDGVDSADLLTAGGSAVDGLVFTTHGFATPGSSLEAFYKKFQLKYNQPADTVFDALGYDLGKIIEAAVLKADSTNGPALRDAIANLENVQGATGTITFKGTSGVPIKSVTLVRVKSGKFELVGQVIPNTADVPAP